jgi:hypothetical protein
MTSVAHPIAQMLWVIGVILRTSFVVTGLGYVVHTGQRADKLSQTTKQVQVKQ